MMYPNHKYFDIFGIDRTDGKTKGKGKQIMLKNLNIENFRGIQKLNISDMRRFVLLSGKNNVGKSTVLEAGFLMMDHLSPDSFTRMNSFRGVNTLSNEVTIWEPLFYQMNPDHIIKIQAQRDNDSLKLSYSKDDSFISAQKQRPSKKCHWKFSVIRKAQLYAAL